MTMSSNWLVHGMMDGLWGGRKGIGRSKLQAELRTVRPRFPPAASRGSLTFQRLLNEARHASKNSLTASLVPFRPSLVSRTAQHIRLHPDC